MAAFRFIGKSAIILALFVTLPVVLSATPASASGVGASPSHLEIADNASDFNGIIHVINTGDEDSLYRVYAEGGYEGWFDIVPQEFLLSAGQVAEVRITVASPGAVAGEHTVNICIESFEASSDLHVGAGIRVPVYISVDRPVPAVTIGVSAAALSVLAAIAYLIWRHNRRLSRRRLAVH
jgi:hypothetical protein